MQFSRLRICFTEFIFCISVSGCWGEEKNICFLNTYNPCELSEKKKLWKEIVDLEQAKGVMSSRRLKSIKCEGEKEGTTSYFIGLRYVFFNIY